MCLSQDRFIWHEVAGSSEPSDDLRFDITSYQEASRSALCDAETASVDCASGVMHSLHGPLPLVIIR